MNNMTINELHDLWCKNEEIEKDNLKWEDLGVAANLSKKPDVQSICLDNKSYDKDNYGSLIFSSEAQKTINDLINKNSWKVSDEFVKTFTEYCHQVKCCFEKYQKENVFISRDQIYRNACDSVNFNFKERLSEKNKPIQVTLKSILSCNDFMVSDFTDMSDYLISIKDLLSICKNMEYKEIIRDVGETTLNFEDKKIFFAQLLPTCDFKIYSEFDSTWDMCKNGYIDFDTLVTKFWNKDNFEQQQNAPNQKNAFQKFAIEYNKYLNHGQLSDKKSISDCANAMIDELVKKTVISKDKIQNLKNRINNASNVGFLGIVAQFFINLFSKDKTAFQTVSKTKQDRVINNLKPLSELLRQSEFYKSNDTRV